MPFTKTSNGRTTSAGRRTRVLVGVVEGTFIEWQPVRVLLSLAQFAPVSPESPNAEGIRDSYLFVSIFVLAIFVLVEGLLIAFIWRYRRQKRARFADGAQVHGATRLELMWTVFPVIVLFLIAAFVFIELPGIKNVPDAEAGAERMEIDVSGHQFYWQYEYENGAISIDTLRAPVGTPVLLNVTAPDSDVIHSWWIPSLGGKIDAIPGVENETWFEANRTGLFQGQCAELCGVEHARMLASVEVVTEREFESWVDERLQEQQAGTGELGQEEWEGVCAKCHGPEGEGGEGPRIAGSPTLTDIDELTTLLRNGRGEMPAVGADWTDEQIEALVSFLEENPPGGS